MKVTILRENEIRECVGMNKEAVDAAPEIPFSVSSTLGRIRTNDLWVISSNPIRHSTKRKDTLIGCLSGSGARIRTWDLRVMSCNPIWYTQ